MEGEIPSRGNSKGRSAERRAGAEEKDLDYKWPPKLKELFELDDDMTEYKNPFKDPRELMENFQTLEEKNLTLIRQC